MTSNEDDWLRAWTRDGKSREKPDERTAVMPSGDDGSNGPAYFESRTYGPGRRAPRPSGPAGRRVQNPAEDAELTRYRQYGTGGGSAGAAATDDAAGRAGTGYAPEPTAPTEPSRTGTRRWRFPRLRGRGLRRALVIALVLVLVLVVGGYFYLDSKLNRIDVLNDYSGRPAATAGQDWLLVGSDSRAGLSREERNELSTGNAGGRRTDTMMLLHIPSGGGKPTLVSLPRDSYVPIPGRSPTKLNAAFAFGGPQLLVQTVEKVTDIRIDRYMEIGFGGFVDVVNDLGGVHMCIPRSIEDSKAALDIKAGCQDLDGPTALGYVRTRATARADLDRVQRQREFFRAVVDRASSPSVLFNPFRVVPLARSSADAVEVDNGTHLFDLGRLAWAMRSDPVTTTVPVAGTPTISGVGSVVQWDRENALRLFRALAADKPVPNDLLK